MASTAGTETSDSGDRPVSLDISKGAKHLVDTNPGLRAIPPVCVLPDAILSEPVAVEAVPVIDLRGLDEPARRAGTVEDIASACSEWGFFCIINHGLDPALMEAMLRAAESFFDLLPEVKMSHAPSPDDAMPPVKYGSNLNTAVGPFAHQWRDFLNHFGRPVDKSSFHLWPADPPAYRDVARDYLEEVWRVAMRVAAAISEALGLEAGYVEGVFGEGSQIVALNYYPPCPEPHRTLGVARHTDRGGVTIIMDNDVDGLQVRREGKWVPVPSLPGCFVVNLGDCMEILTNGRYKSVEHRVVVNEKRKRITIAVGNGPGHEEIIQPTPHLVEQEVDGRSKYMPVVFKELRFGDNVVIKLDSS